MTILISFRIKGISDFKFYGLINDGITICITATRNDVDVDVLTRKYIDNILLSEKIKLQY